MCQQSLSTCNSLAVVELKKGETPEEPVWWRNREHPVISCQALGAKHKEAGWVLRLSKGETKKSCVDVYECGICASVPTAHLCACNSFAVVKNNIKLDSHANSCVVGDHFLIVHDHN